MRIFKLFVIYLIVIIYSLEILTFLFIPSEQKSMVDVKNTRIKLAKEKKIKFTIKIKIYQKFILMIITN